MGNCLERNESGNDNDNDSSDSTPSHQHHQSTSRHNNHRSHRHHHRSSNNSYSRINNNNSSSSSSLISLNSTQQQIVTQNQDINHNYLQGTSLGGSFQTHTGSSINFSPSSSLPDSLRLGQAGGGGSSVVVGGGLGNSVSQQQVFYLTPNVQRTADQLTEEEQIKLLKRMTLIQQLPCGFYDENKKNKECVICMIDFEIRDGIKCLPCMHTFHQSCIDSWLVRSLICPSCMEPVDAGLLSAFE